MNMRFETEVPGYYTEVMSRFDRTLFEALAPPLVPLNIMNFTGSKTGDLVHLKFGGIINTEWISKIIDHGIDEENAFFIDQGTKLPFPLKTWHHRHIVQKIGPDRSKIIDDIDFESYNPLMSALIYPLLYLGFKPRGKIYRQYFSSVKTSSR